MGILIVLFLSNVCVIRLTKILQGWIGRRDDKNFTFFSPAGECLKTRKKMLECKEFEEASKEDQKLLTEFKPQGSISLDRAHPERRRTLDDTSKEQSETLENPTEEKENIEQKSKLLRLDTSSTKTTTLGSSTKKTSYLPKGLKFLRACVEVNAYPTPQEKSLQRTSHHLMSQDALEVM